MVSLPDPARAPYSPLQLMSEEQKHKRFLRESLDPAVRREIVIGMNPQHPDMARVRRALATLPTWTAQLRALESVPRSRRVHAGMREMGL